jgi:hypothetical protein
VLMSTDSVSAAASATTRSGFWSPFKSPTATDDGLRPAVQGLLYSR